MLRGVEWTGKQSETENNLSKHAYFLEPFGRTYFSPLCFPYFGQNFQNLCQPAPPT